MELTLEIDSRKLPAEEAEKLTTIWPSDFVRIFKSSDGTEIVAQTVRQITKTGDFKNVTEWFVPVLNTAFPSKKSAVFALEAI